VSLRAFEEYQREQAWTWEHMALTRARPVFGSPGGREAVAGVLREILCRPYDHSKLVADAVKMREDMAAHKAPSGPLDVKLGHGGLVDLEFAVHVLQLTSKKGLFPRLESAVEALAGEGLIDTNIVEAQKLLTQILVTIRLLAPRTGTPAQESCDLMAKACGSSSWDELLARHDAARQSVSRLWERVKEGKLQ